MPVIEWHSHPLVKDNYGKVALQRGPFVYCLEEEDNGENLHLLNLQTKPDPQEINDNILGKYVSLKGMAERHLIDDSWNNYLYQSENYESIKEIDVTFIPYHLWANRSVGEMKVWVNKK